eukprot:TRINITY_DN1211_c0_g1_i1.p1 TRINITY_DN1211_c0_g1~~TRINITY_DN1211_c0_g1_i1.p1  ORF type:complete len:441 (+),score=103.83 TRINITY_DN1211_c0_g1_i1:31-1353(+)
MPKRSSSDVASAKQNRAPLHKQLADDTFVNPNKKNERHGKKPKNKNQKSPTDLLSANMSKKILNSARKQQEEIELEANENLQETKTSADLSQFRSTPPAFSSKKNKKLPVDSDDEDFSEDEDSYLQEEIVLDDEEARTLAQFMSSEKPARINLTETIFEKIREKEKEASAEGFEKKFDPRVVQNYRAVGRVLKTYSVGKVPKAFKIIPSLVAWEEILLFTNPDEWSPQATFQATRLFASNMNPKMAQRFFSMILLPAVRNNIAENKKLNFHLYMSLKKSLYKPSAFFKGLLLPLCESKTCTLKEAVIIGSVVSKVTIPILQSAAALLKLAEMKYNGTNSYFIRLLVEKKYALPFRVIDALVLHFQSFMSEDRVLPVLWHQALLAFTENYKTDLTAEQKEALKQLIRKHTHRMITDNIRRELISSRCRGEEPEVPLPMVIN